MLFDLHVEGEAQVPEKGAVILASNHPTYLDPAFIMVKLRRPVRFLAWERPFRVPVLGLLMKRYGAIPVNIDRPGRASFEAAAKVLRSGEVFGIFPEGGRSHFGTMNPLKSGVARLAMMTGAPIIPITIRGGHRVWHKDQLFPRPGPVSVQFHPPMILESKKLSSHHRRSQSLVMGAPTAIETAENARDKEYERDIVDKLVKTINQSLLPSVRAEHKEDRVYQEADVPVGWNPELLPYLSFIIAWLLLPRFRQIVSPALLGWLTLYAGYLLVHRTVRLNTPWTLALRQLSPWIVYLGILFSTLLSRDHIGLAVVFLLICLWYQTFRFYSYRKFRKWGLVLAYLIWTASWL
ncbi:MAG: 1-acyl-sn-glycerol-3-phosphate acyltransferase [Elusimicrobia bacterium]|nr:1-acyl-sn-glycerol-3-phosphate acyltransferase [Elusimicrobiota bacterium]